jgi:hypothetical protein
VHHDPENKYWGADRKDRIDPKSMKPGATPGLPAKSILCGKTRSLKK